MPIYSARYHGRVLLEDRDTQVSFVGGPTIVSSWRNDGTISVGPTSSFGKWYEAQYERSREITPPGDDASRVCHTIGSSSYNSAASTTYEARWTLRNPLIACTVEYAIRTRNATTGVFTYGGFSSVALTATSLTSTVTIPLPAAAHDSNTFVWRACFRPFMSHTT